jgi:hypothetical protein
LNQPDDPTSRLGDVVADLVEYMIISIPDVGALAALAPALTDLVGGAAVRILDLVVLVKDEAGDVTAMEIDALDALSSLRTAGGQVPGLLSERDIELASSVLGLGTTAVLLVTEDRWAEPLSAAARRVGGQIISGERIAPSRVASAQAEGPAAGEGG